MAACANLAAATLLLLLVLCATGPARADEAAALACQRAYISADKSAEAAKCLAIDNLGRCLGLALTDSQGTALEDEFDAYLAGLQAEQECSNYETGNHQPTLESTSSGSLVVETDAEQDVYFRRYRRETTSVWSQEEAISTLQSDMSVVKETLQATLNSSHLDDLATKGYVSDAVNNLKTTIADTVDVRNNASREIVRDWITALDGKVDAVQSSLQSKVSQSDLDSAINATEVRATAARQLIQSNLAGVSATVGTATLDIAGLKSDVSTLKSNAVDQADLTVLQNSLDAFRLAVETCTLQGKATKQDGTCQEVSASTCSAAAAGILQRGGDVCLALKHLDGSTSYDFVPVGTMQANNIVPVGKSAKNPGTSCKAIKTADTAAKTGLYWLRMATTTMQTYCEMTVDGGGWTLVASINEDDPRKHCNEYDRWSGTSGCPQGGGTGNWINTEVFGSADMAAADDYKSPAYHLMSAKNMMVMNVPNGTPLDLWYGAAWIVQYSSNNFLSSYGGNLKTMLTQLGINYKSSCSDGDQGPVVPVTYAKGDDRLYDYMICPNCRGESTPGQWAFARNNHECSRFAFCQATNSGGKNIEHWCLAGDGYVHGHMPFCGNDYPCFDWQDLGSGYNTEWSGMREWSLQTTMMLYRE